MTERFQVFLCDKDNLVEDTDFFGTLNEARQYIKENQSKFAIIRLYKLRVDGKRLIAEWNKND